MIHFLLIPFIAYGHAFAHIAHAGGDNPILPVLILVIWPAFIVVGICALVDSAIN